MPDIKEMLELAEALEIVKEQVACKKLASETICVQDSLGRTIVEDQIACIDIPPFNKSAMDGFAVGDDGELDEYRIIESVAAGSVPSKRLIAGTCTKVMTGTAVPDGAVKVIKIEQTRESDGKVRVLSHTKAANICRQGEDVRKGDVIVGARSVLGPAEIGNLVSVGITEVKVARSVLVSIILTGDELVDSADKLCAGKIMDCNGPMLSALCQKYGLEVVSYSIVPDDLDKTKSALSDGLEKSDIVIFSGGVSVGDLDFVAEAMKETGLQLHFNRVAVKPGKPMTFGSSGERIVFGLPGNPVAVYLMFHLFVLYAARVMAGQKCQVRYVGLPLACDFNRRKGDRQVFLPCRVTGDGRIEPTEYHGTAHLRSLLESDGFFIVPKGVVSICAGERVDFTSLSGSFQ